MDVSPELLKNVKTQLEILTDDEDIDNNIRLKILAVMVYLSNGGASEESLKSPLAISCISIGVNDLLENKAGGSSFSPAFNTIANQICR